jgi:hypothetical protein
VFDFPYPNQKTIEKNILFYYLLKMGTENMKEGVTSP